MTAFGANFLYEEEEMPVSLCSSFHGKRKREKGRNRERDLMVVKGWKSNRTDWDGTEERQNVNQSTSKITSKPMRDGIHLSALWERQNSCSEHSRKQRQF